MLALDFKLTSAQVKELLFIWHGASNSEHDDSWLSYPALIPMRSDAHLRVSMVLEAKGLITRRAADDDWHRGAPDSGSIRWYCTPAGAAVAEMIVRQAALVMAVDASRRERFARFSIPSMTGATPERTGTEGA